jgi:hypothetical protein
MKTALAIIAVIAAIPLTLLADKEKDVKVKVPDKSGVSVEDIKPTGLEIFKLKNTNDYPVRVTGSYGYNIKEDSGAYSAHTANFDLELTAHVSQPVENRSPTRLTLTEITVEKVEKKN